MYPWGHPYQRNPDVYLPYVPGPYPYGYPHQNHGSTKYPQLIFLLASDGTHLHWDVRDAPTSIHPTTFLQHRHTIVTQNSVRKMRIISKAFPWSIVIDSNVPITCEMVWEGLYQGLQKPMEDSEWGMLCIKKKSQREVVEKAAKKRRELDSEDKVHMKRIDYLGEETMFAGLDRDEDFAKLRIFPGSTEADTWVVSFKK